MSASRSQVIANARKYLIVSTGAVLLDLVHAYLNYKATIWTLSGIVFFPLILGYLPLKLLTEFNRVLLPDKRSMNVQFVSVILCMNALFLKKIAINSGLLYGLSKFFAWAGILTTAFAATSYAVHLKRRKKVVYN